MDVPKPRKTKSGNWSIQMRLGGISKTFTSDSKREVIREAELYKVQYKHGLIDVHAPKRNRAVITLRQAMDDYINAKDNVLSPSTIRGYDDIMNYRFKSVIDKPISSITDWQTVVNDEADLVSPKTMLNAWSFTKSALERQGINPGEVTLPALVKHEHTFLDPDEAKRFIRLLHGTNIEMASLIALHSLRKSEMLPLEKKDIIYDKKEQRYFIHVSGSIVQDKDNNWVEKDENKTLDSARTIPVIIDRLAELVNQSPPGKLITVHPNTVYKRIVKFCKDNGFPDLGYHGFRHTFVVLCFEAGLPAYTTYRIGGWKSPRTVDEIYFHLSTKQKMRAFGKVGDLLKG